MNVAFDQCFLKAHTLYIAEVTLVSWFKSFVVSWSHMIGVAIKQFSVHVHEVGEVGGTH